MALCCADSLARPKLNRSLATVGLCANVGPAVSSDEHNVSNQAARQQVQIVARMLGATVGATDATSCIGSNIATTARLAAVCCNTNAIQSSAVRRWPCSNSDAQGYPNWYDESQLRATGTIDAVHKRHDSSGATDDSAEREVLSPVKSVVPWLTAAELPSHYYLPVQHPESAVDMSCRAVRKGFDGASQPCGMSGQACPLIMFSDIQLRGGRVALGAIELVAKRVREDRWPFQPLGKLERSCLPTAKHVWPLIHGFS
eukprot:SAG31_NODE_865_length_11376_cov_4.313377_8_plen_257_part_00